MAKIFITFFASSLILFSNAQKSAKRELRGVWITTYLGLDWPVRTHTPAQQQIALQSILDHHKETGLNTVYFQVRSQSDAMYSSKIEPWSFDLTGYQGKAPSQHWDPLQFAVEESQKRGLEFHAWINPFRAVANLADSKRPEKISSMHISKKHPEWLLTSGTAQILNPGIPEVRTYINNVIIDILKRYDVDGIHFDDYFYPQGYINDNAAYNADPRGFPNTTAGRADWRRDNINLFIKTVYDSIKKIKPWVKFGVSPTGIYLSSTNPNTGSLTSSGTLQHFSAYFADTKRWLKEGWVDYIAPQVYWYIGKSGADYAQLIPWWNNNAFGRHIYIGIAAYNISSTSKEVQWANRAQIPSKIKMNRSKEFENVRGDIYFRTAFLKTNALNFRDSLRTRYYNYPALLPTMPWRDNVAPNAASNLTAVKFGNDSVVLTWNKPEHSKDELQRVRQFVIYRSIKPSIDINDEKNILSITVNDNTTYTDVTIEPNTTYYYTVTALDRFHNESKTTNVANNLTPVVSCPDEQIVKSNGSFSIVPDFRLLSAVDGIPAYNNRQVNIIQTPAPRSKVMGNEPIKISLSATDKAGNSGFCSFIVTINDTTATQVKKAVKAPVVQGELGKTEKNNKAIDKLSEVKKENKGLNVKVAPNPATNAFTINITGTSKKPVSLKVVDGIGKVIEKRKKVPSSSSIILGSNYKPGIYYLLVKQGKETQDIKMVKSSK